ncbi:MAG: hypothetical protein CVU64_24595, partial [Deltaproteobacteria bacterium HGW-Deltaproteobacteria-21]
MEESSSKFHDKEVMSNMIAEYRTKRGEKEEEMTRREFIVDGSIVLGGTVGLMTMGGDFINPQ